MSNVATGRAGGPPPVKPKTPEPTPPPQVIHGDVGPGTRQTETQTQQAAANVKPQTPNASRGLIEVSGAGQMPWDNTGVPAPNPLAPTAKPKATKPATIEASRGVIGTIRQQAQLNNVPVALALAVAREESGYRQEAVSSAGAIGVMQLMPDTARGLNVDPNNWKQNIEGGVKLLGMLIRQYNGDVNKALQAYNGGPGNVGSAETQHYAKTVLSIASQISNGKYKPAGGSTGVITISAPLPGNPVVTSGFGPRNLDGAGDFHEGVDLAAPQGTPIHAMIGGVVTFSGWTDGTGNMVTIKDKSGRLWSYFHMVTTPIAKQGQKLKAGVQIGNVGSTGMSTGPHLDIHLMVNGQYVNPMALIRKAFKAGWNKTKTITVSTTDMTAPGNGGVNGTGQTASGSGEPFINAVTGQDAQVPQTVDAAVTPGGQAAIPSNAQAWQRILDSGAAAPETKNLAARAGAVVDNADPLAAVYNNPGGAG